MSRQPEVLTPRAPAETTPAGPPATAAAGGRAASVLDPTDGFPRRHLGSSEAETAEMLARLGLDSLEELAREAVPAAIRLAAPLALSPLPGGDALPRAPGERELLVRMQRMAAKNEIFRSYLRMGYHDTVVPPVIQRNILENPG